MGKLMTSKGKIMIPKPKEITGLKTVKSFA